MTAPIRPEHADKVEPIPGADPRLTIRRHLASYAYPRNGNVHNPTPQYLWLLLADGRTVDQSTKRAPLIEAARTNGAAYLGEVEARARELAAADVRAAVLSELDTAVGHADATTPGDFAADVIAALMRRYDVGQELVDEDDAAHLDDEGHTDTDCPSPTCTSLHVGEPSQAWADRVYGPDPVECPEPGCTYLAMDAEDQANHAAANHADDDDETGAPLAPSTLDPGELARAAFLADRYTYRRA